MNAFVKPTFPFLFLIVIHLFTFLIEVSIISIEKYQESLNDARAAIDLQPAFLRAIERGEVKIDVSRLCFLISNIQ